MLHVLYNVCTNSLHFNETATFAFKHQVKGLKNREKAERRVCVKSNSESCPLSMSISATAKVCLCVGGQGLHRLHS